jgi:hypothetical protein
LPPHCTFRCEGSCGRSIVQRKLGDSLASPREFAASADALLAAPGVRAEVAGTGPACSMVKGFRCRNCPAKPSYENRRLWLGHFQVLEFAREAWDQIAIVDSFQLLGWPERIASPLGKGIHAKYAIAMKNAVQRLNARRDLHVIRFHAYEFDREIGWGFEHRLRDS